MISTTAQYALRAVIYLAEHQDGFVVRKEIAEATLVPHDYLLKVLNGLDAAGIVESRRGPNGGYRLMRPPKKISSLEVVQSVDGIQRISQCPLGFPNHHRLCPLHQLMDDANRLIIEAYGKVTIDALVSQRNQPNTCNFPNHRSATK